MPKELKYSASAMLRARRAASLKSQKLPVGTRVTFTEIEVNPESTAAVNRDTILGTLDTGEARRIPIREFANMKTSGGQLISFERDEEQENFILPLGFVIKSSKDRVVKRGDQEITVYPIQAYNAGAAQIAAAANGDPNAFDFDKLVASELTEEGKKMDPVQDYEIELLTA